MVRKHTRWKFWVSSYLGSGWATPLQTQWFSRPSFRVHILGVNQPKLFGQFESGFALREPVCRIILPLKHSDHELTVETVVFIPRMYSPKFKSLAIGWAKQSIHTQMLPWINNNYLILKELLVTFSAPSSERISYKTQTWNDITGKSSWSN